ncbi:MAG: winged helix DNA-binding domain-containing protein, partial [Firmicutes bacterium]|nr:winged helix DNA-binding domain-containing protein [Bacillota bacterium]
FILLKQGLIDEYKFADEQGVCDFVKQAGCIQFDPIDVCGKNAELVLQSRVKGFTKAMLNHLLYEERKLLDYFDKNLSIISTADWPYFARIREAYRQNTRSYDEVKAVTEEIKDTIRKKGNVCSKDVGFNKKVDWYWSDTKLARAALETLYFQGDLIIHHKKGTSKYYAFTEEHLPAAILTAEDPHQTEFEYLKWRALRRISAVGLLWNKPSAAWLGIEDFKAAERNAIFTKLILESKILQIEVENIKDSFYCLASDEELIETVLTNPTLAARTELIAPLDNMLWDRKLIKTIFNLEYKWEIYTPKAQRQYGHYVLPILSGEQFVGRAELVNEKKAQRLVVKNVWLENGVKTSSYLESDIADCFQRFATFNQCELRDAATWHHR